ncbi:MAG: phosphate/phosphite/phosphonate ABC transporter substrate-binding protein [Bacteroidota bacterium]
MKLFFLLLGTSLAVSACTPASNLDKRKQRIAARKTIQAASAGALDQGTEDRPIRFYFTPSVDHEEITIGATAMLNFLHHETGFHYQLHIPANYEEMIQAFGEDKAHVAMMSSLSYVRANEAHGARAVLKSVRYNSPNYFGQIIANVGSGITSIKDISQKSMVYTDVVSGSGYLYPKMMLESIGIQPSHVSFAGKHDKVVEIVYRGMADAGATFHAAPTGDGTIRDARAKLLKKYPDVADKVKVIAVTDPIPNDPVVFNRNMSRQMQFDISLAMVKFIATPEGKEAMESLYSMQGYVRCSDEDYDGLREALRYSERSAL